MKQQATQISLDEITDIKEVKVLLADEFLRQIELNNAQQQSSKNVDLLLAKKAELEKASAETPSEPSEADILDSLE